MSRTFEGGGEGEELSGSALGYLEWLEMALTCRDEEGLAEPRPEGVGQEEDAPLPGLFSNSGSVEGRKGRGRGW